MKKAYARVLTLQEKGIILQKDKAGSNLWNNMLSSQDTACKTEKAKLKHKNRIDKWDKMTQKKYEYGGEVRGGNN